MKKVKRAPKNDLRSAYKRSDFVGPLVRGKYAKRLKQSSNIVVLQPEVAAAFPNDETVNAALRSLIRLAKVATRPTKRSGGRSTKHRAA
jgi:hypothetical protein